jgi:hypothetical protein
MNFLFTNKYYLINSYTFNNNNIIKIGVDNPTRWICDIKKSPITANGDYEFTFYDNYSEIYRIKLLNGEYIYNSKKILFNNNELLFIPSDTTLFQLPDIAINVLKTIADPIGIETLRRIANQVNIMYRSV